MSMNQHLERDGQKPAHGDQALEQRYETGKGCLILLASVVGFLVVSVALVYLASLASSA